MGTDASNFSNSQSQNSPWIYDDEADRKKHMAYMTSIAEEKHKDLLEVASFYENILVDLKGQARVHDFLNIFVAKKVLEKLKGAE